MTLITMVVCFPLVANAANRYAVANGDWNSTSTWSSSSGGSSGASVPGSGDAVFIGESGSTYSVTIPSGYNASAASLEMGTGKNCTLDFAASSSTLTVGGNVNLLGPTAGSTLAINLDNGQLTIGGTLHVAKNPTGTQSNKVSILKVTTGTVTVGGDLLFDGLHALQSQIVFSGSGTLNLAGNFTVANSLGTVTPSTGTFNFNGTSAQTIPIGVGAITYNNIVCNNTSASGATISAAISAASVTGNFSVQSGTFTNGGYDIVGNAGSTFSVSNGATFQLTGTSSMVTGFGTKSFGSTSTVEYGGTNQSVSAETYGHLTLSGSGTKTMPGSSMTLSGNFTMSGTPSAMAAQAMTVWGNFTVGSGCTFNASSYAHTLKADFSNSGTFTASTSTVTFNGNSAEAIGGSSTTTFNNLTLNNSNGLTLNTSATVGATLTLSAGTLDVGTSTLTLNSSVSATSGSLSSSSTGTVHYNQGSNGQSVLAANYGNLTFSNFNKTLPSSGTVGIAGTFTPGAASGHTITGSTVNYNGTGAQTVAASNYNNLTISGARTTNNVTIVSSGTIGVAGTLSLTATFTSGVYIVTGSTVEYNGSGAQTIASTNYHNLTLSNGGTKTFASGTTGIAGTFTINAGPTADATTNTSTITYNGGGAQTVFRMNYHSLTLSNAGTKTLTSGTTRIAGGLTISGSATADATTNSTTVEYNGSGTQTVLALAYYSLTLNTSGTKTFAAGTTSIANSFTLSGSATADATTNSSTVSYNGGGAQSVAAINYHHLTLGNAGVKTFAAGTSGIAGTFTISGTASANATANTSTIAYDGSGAQSVLAINYHHLTLGNAGVKTFAAGTSGIAGTFTLGGSASADATTNTATVDYNGGAQTVAAIQYHHLTLSVSGTKTFAAGTIGIAGTLTISGAASANATANTPTTNYNGSGVQMIANISYHHLTLSGGNSKTPAAGLSVAGNFTIGGSTTFSAGSLIHTVQGNWSNSGTFTAGTSTVEFTGGNDASITGATTFSTLVVNKNGGTNTITLNNNVSTATLTMTQGKISTGANAITVTSTRTGNGLVIGTITRTHTFSASTPYAFEGPYQTLTFNSGGTLPTSVTVTTTLSSPGANSYMEPIDRYYDVSQVGGSGFTYTLRLHYEDSEVSNPNSETSPPLKIWRRTSTGPDVWTREGSTSNSTTNNWVEQTGLTNVGTFSLSSRTVANMVLTLNANTTNPIPGQQVTYTISYSNTGDGTSTNTLVTAAAPVNTTYVANSTIINAVPKTDAADADEVTVSGLAITINLGTVAASGSGTITYKVAVN